MMVAVNKWRDTSDQTTDTSPHANFPGGAIISDGGAWTPWKFGLASLDADATAERG